MRLREAALGAALALAAAAPAAAGALPVWARDLANAGAAQAPPDCPAIILLDDTAMRVDRDLRTHVVRRVAMRLLTSEGVAEAVLAVELEPGGAIEDFNSWTCTGGDVRATARSSERVESMLSSAGPTDVRRVALAAREPRTGDVVLFEAIWNESAPFPVHLWLPQESNLPVLRAELALDLPRGWSAQARALHAELLDASPRPEVVRLAVTGLSRLPNEPRRPSDSRLMPRVLVRLDDGTGHSPFARWESLAEWYEALARASADARACPDALRLPPGRDDSVAVVAELSRRVQMDVRYVAVELGMRRWQPDSAVATWRARYGDCKDKAALLASALEANGIRARLVLACTRDRWDVDPNGPSPYEFDHCIVALRWPGPNPPAAATVRTSDGHEWTLFDPTDDRVPLGCISAALGGTYGLIAAADGGLVRFPDATASTLRRVVTARLSENGDLSGRFTVRADGPASEALRGRFGGPGADVLRARAREYLGGHWARAVLDSCAIVADSSASQRFELEMQFQLKGAARPSGARLLFAPRFESSGGDPPPDDSVRTLPIELGTPGHYEEEWRVELPPGFAPEQRAPIEWHGSAGDYAARFEAASGQLVVWRRLDLRVAEMPAADFAQAKALLKAVYAGERSSVVLARR